MMLPRFSIRRAAMAAHAVNMLLGMIGALRRAASPRSSPMPYRLLRRVGVLRG